MKPRTRLLLGLAALALVTALAVYYFTKKGAVAEGLTVKVQEGLFEITVTSPGELEAEKSTKIQGPGSLNAFNIYNIKIDALVPEGTRVKKGEFVASLSPSDLNTKLTSALSELEKAQAQHTSSTLDTSLTLRQARDEIQNNQLSVREKELVLQQSRYEPPATIRQAELDLERAKRTLSQSRVNYGIKVKQAAAKVAETSATLSTFRNNTNQITRLLSQLQVKAPADGMVIYERSWNGQRLVTGSDVNTWDPTVATLPDLSSMLSRTYVNEVDIRRVSAGQAVAIGLDAFPEKKLTGKVMSVANVGEQRPGTQAKVFEVRIAVHQKDTSLRPAMTSSNRIVCGRMPKERFVPLEAIFSQGDSLSFAYVKTGGAIERRQVRLGATNENQVIIADGLTTGEELYLTAPEDGAALPLKALSNSKKKALARK